MNQKKFSHLDPTFRRKINSSAKSESGTSFQNSIRTIGELHSNRHVFIHVHVTKRETLEIINRIFLNPTGEPGKFPAFRFDLLPESNSSKAITIRRNSTGIWCHIPDVSMHNAHTHRPVPREERDKGNGSPCGHFKKNCPTVGTGSMRWVTMQPLAHSPPFRPATNVGAGHTDSYMADSRAPDRADIRHIRK
jgi:hypothetical protein